ncbi:MAG: single-stranded DNA-binding protein [Clostridiales bacterium]|jgi:single-stranded DNA-binding protein|nr:single-stranded DNA-binding protein [Clostridiales bacterium]
MFKEKPEITNSIELRGRLSGDFVFSHEIYSEKFYSFTVEVPRLSKASDFLPVTISEKLIKDMDFKIGSLVDIFGQVRSYNNYVQTEGRNRLLITVFAREMLYAKDENGENIEGEDENSPNNVYLNGFICKPPIFRQTPFGREISDILLAVNRSYNKSDYIPCICWGRNARYVSDLKVSDNIVLHGRMQSRQYQKKLENGQILEKTAYEISVSKIETPDGVEDIVDGEREEQ